MCGTFATGCTSAAGGRAGEIVAGSVGKATVSEAPASGVIAAGLVEAEAQNGCGNAGEVPIGLAVIWQTRVQ